MTMENKQQLNEQELNNVSGSSGITDFFERLFGPIFAPKTNNGSNSTGNDDRKIVLRGPFDKHNQTTNNTTPSNNTLNNTGNNNKNVVVNGNNSGGIQM